MSFRTSLGVLLAFLPCLSLAQGRSSKEQKTQVDGVRLGRPDIEISGATYSLPLAGGHLFAKSTELRKTQSATWKHSPTTDQWVAAEALGILRDASAVIRMYVSPTEDQQIQAAKADIGIVFMKNGDGFDVKGHVDLTRLAENGLLSRDFVKSLIQADSLTNAEKGYILQLLKRSMVVSLGAQQAFVKLHPGPSVGYDTKLSLDAIGIGVEFETVTFWGDLWSGVHETVNGYLEALDGFVKGRREIEWNAKCGVDGCRVMVIGKL